MSEAFSPLHLLHAHTWRRAAFTTYALSLSFFEAVVLDALVRKGVEEKLVIADIDGVRSALSEQGARRVGRDYEVEPIAVGSGVFHPKLTLLDSDDETHIVVGSGNLTFGGWGGNLEVFEHLHAGYAADALKDTAGFLVALGASDRVSFEARNQSLAWAEILDRAGDRGASTGRVRLLHSLDRSIIDQVGDLATELGGARRLTVASPYWDGGRALDRLCGALGLDHAHVHAHPHMMVEGRAGTNWPFEAKTPVQPVEVVWLSQDTKKRRLHGKLFEVLCRRGRVVLSGSANATGAALGLGNNIEASVARIEREPVVGWVLSPGDLPSPTEESEASELDEALKPGVLRAVLTGDEIEAKLVGGSLSEPVQAFAVSAEGVRSFGAAVLDDGTYRIRAPGLEIEGWRGSRLTLRLGDEHGRTAEGFLSFAGYSAIVRRAGAVANRLFALIAGTETPEDVAAIMTWLNEDPTRLRREGPIGGGGNGRAAEAEVLVDVGRLLDVPLEPTAGPAAANAPAVGWRRFMDYVFAAFREPRGPFSGGAGGQSEDDDADETETPPTTNSVNDPAIGRSLEVFDRLFNLMLESERGREDLGAVFDLTQYVCDRIQPEAAIVRAYFKRLVDAFVATPGLKDASEHATAAFTLDLAIDSSPSTKRRTRDRLWAWGIDPNGPAPDLMRAEGLRKILAPNQDLSVAWEDLKTLTSIREQVRAYIAALARGSQSAEYPDLRDYNDVWPILDGAFSNSRDRKMVFSVGRASGTCPKHHAALPVEQARRLNGIGIGRAANCCGAVLLCKEA